MNFEELLGIVPKHYGVICKVLVKGGYFYSVFESTERVKNAYKKCEVLKVEVLYGGVINVLLKDTEDFKEEHYED